jgi:RES domain-containing protein
VIGYRQVDSRFPFLWEDASQPAARWHGEGEGPAHYFADTPDGAWAEFLRHEEIRDPEQVSAIERTLWAVDLPDEALVRPELPDATLTGDPSTYPTCQAEARSLRDAGATGLRAPSAALLPGTAGGWRVEAGLQPGPSRSESVVVLFGRRPELVGWAACSSGRPREDLLLRVRYFGEQRVLS